MAWWRFSLTCQAGELEQVENLLIAAGAQSLSLEDAGDEPIYEPLPGDTPMWRDSIVSALFDDKMDPESLLQTLLGTLPAHLGGSLRRDRLSDQDWEQAYREHFKPLHCGRDLWIVPSWCEAPDPSAINIQLDPGMAFGTGAHPTTYLCLAWLADNHADGASVIDYGCGSGILAIAALKLGAHRVTAVDIDPQALSACQANLQVNAVPIDSVDVCLPQDLPATPVDLLLANILAGPLLDLAPQFAALVRSGGQILLSGILKTQLKEIQLAYQPFFKLDPARCREEWACLNGQRT